MPTTPSVGTADPRTYRRASTVAYAVGIVAFLAGLAAGRPIAGLVVYLAGFGAGLAIPSLSPRTVYDERDEELAGITNGIVVSVVGYGGFAVFVGAFAAEQFGSFTMSSELLAVFYAWSAFWLVWGATYLFVRARR